MNIVSKTTSTRHWTVNSILDKSQILHIQELVHEVPFPDHLLHKPVKLVSQTRPGTGHSTALTDKFLSWGAGPRASQYLALGAKTSALSQGRFNVELEDIKALAIQIGRAHV